MPKVTLWILFLAAFAYGCFCLFLYIRQRSLIYYPHPEVSARDILPTWLENDSQKLKIWQDGPEGKTPLLYFGGNAENVLHSRTGLRRLFPEYTVYLMNYRGYGGSSGSPSEAALFSDALALYDRVATEHEDVMVMGRSLGTAVAAYLAAERPVKAMILVTPYSSMVALARNYYPYLPVNLLLKDRYESDIRAARIETPVLTLIAEHDEVIPVKISGALVDAFKTENVDKVVIEGAHHNTIDEYPKYYRSIQNFMDNLQTEREQ